MADESNKESKFDDLLIRLGTGRWNGFYFFVICWFCFFLPGQVLSIVFAVPSVDFKCMIPDDEETESSQDLVNACTYSVNSSLSGLQEKHCLEFEFENSTYSRTLTSEYQLVCGRNYLRAAYHSVFMIGNVLGSPIAGVLSDRYGRKLVAVTGGFIFGFTAIILPFVQNIWGILAVRFVTGFSNLPTAYILALEVCEPRMRSFVGILLALPWALGTVAFGGIAYFVRDWHWLQFIMSLPIIILLPAIWLLDESPRWLIVMGRHEKALKILSKAARWNKATLPPESQLRAIMKDIQDENNPLVSQDSDNSLTESQRLSQEDSKNESKTKRSCRFSCGLCSTAHMRTITLTMTLCFCVSSLVFHGLTLSASNFSMNVFAYIFLGGLIEIPAYIVPAFVIARVGRRLPLSICFLVCGIALLLLIVIPEDTVWMIVILALTGKLGISSAGQMVYLYLSELYPTEYRLQGMGTAILAQRLGSITAPLIVHVLGPLVWWAPSAFMGAFSIIAGMATLRLPETLGAILPDTIGDLDILFESKRKRESRKAVDAPSEEMSSMCT